VLKIIVEGHQYVIITSTPTPENILTVAAQFEDASTTPTPLPANWVTPVVVTAIPPPANAATATYQVQVITAEAIVYGTATPTPANVWTATPTPIIIPLPGGLPTASISPTPTPAPIPEVLVGKIVFLSDRANPGGSQPLAYVMDAGDNNIALLTDIAIYEALATRDKFAARQEFTAFVREVKQEDGKQRPAIFFYDYVANRAEQLTSFNSSIAYQPAWSPTQERIAFVSNDSGTEEIWAVNRNKSDLQQLTRDDPTALDGHPSWSPDGAQIVFWSNRTGRKQIWVMNANGSDPRHLHQSDFNDWNPIWIKYTDFVVRPIPGK
jgi:hypothetical protein